MSSTPSCFLPFSDTSLSQAYVGTAASTCLRLPCIQLPMWGELQGSKDLVRPRRLPGSCRLISCTICRRGEGAVLPEPSPVYSDPYPPCLAAQAPRIRTVGDLTELLDCAMDHGPSGQGMSNGGATQGRRCTVSSILDTGFEPRTVIISLSPVCLQQLVLTSCFCFCRHPEPQQVVRVRGGVHQLCALHSFCRGPVPGRGSVRWMPAQPPTTLSA